MTGWPTKTIQSFATAIQKTGNSVSGAALVWNLNLDQIEAHRGRVLKKIFVDHKKLGPSTFAFEPRTVLYSKLRPYLNKVVVADEAGFATTELVPLRCNANEVHPEYLAYFLRSEDFLRFATEVVAGAKMPRMVMSEFWNFQVPIPPISEQRRIAAILDQADSLRSSRRESLEQLDSLREAIFIEMFGDPRANELEWPLAPISSFIAGMRGGAPLAPEDFTDAGFPILHKGAIKPNGNIQVDAKKKTFASRAYAASKPNCIANRTNVVVTLRDLVPSGPSIGLAADLRFGPFDEYILAQGAYALALDSKKITAEYFVQLSNMPTFRNVLRQNAVGSTQIHIRTPIYLAISLPLPPIKLQNAFTEKIKAITILKSSLQIALAESDKLFISLQHRAFRGEL